MKKQTVKASKPAKAENVETKPVIIEREMFQAETIIGDKKANLSTVKAITVNETILSTDGSRNYKAWTESGKKIDLEKSDLVQSESDDKTATYKIDFSLFSFLYHFHNRLSKPIAPNMIYDAKNDLRMYRYFLTRSTASVKAQAYFKAESLKGIDSIVYEENGNYFLQFQA